MTKHPAAILVLLLLIFAASCSDGAGPVSPTSPDQPREMIPPRQLSTSESFLWGIWEFHVDLESQSVEAIPVRNAQLTLNSNKFMNGPPQNLLTEMDYVDQQPGYVEIGITIGLRHPFPGLNIYTGFDVMGVFMGDGSSQMPGPDGFAIAGENDQRLMNPDGYTRWFNSTEFASAGDEMPIQGYYPGSKGTSGYVPSAVINPYRYFTDGLGPNGDAFEHLLANSIDRGVSKPVNINYRQFIVRFPDASDMKFQYAVVARWKMNNSYPLPPDTIDDFPPEANIDEAPLIRVDDSSTVYYGENSVYGGDVILDITPWDWSAELSAPGTQVEEYQISCYSPAWFGASVVDMTPTASGEHNYTFHVEIPVETMDSPDPLPVWIEVRYPGKTYGNQFGVENDADGFLASYFRIDVTVSPDVPEDPMIIVTSPNGGEIWVNGNDYDITWESQFIIGNIFIQYSNDDFTDHIELVAFDETNDGLYTWEAMDAPASDTMKIRVSSMADSQLNDVSDDVFSIVEQEIVVVSPNGGEELITGESWNIEWTSQYVPSTVNIEYSKDGFGSDINEIALDEPNDGSFLWGVIPQDYSDTVLVRISSTMDSSVNDISDGHFIIAEAPSLEVVSPNGGETLIIEEAGEITWDWTGNITTVRIDLSDNSGGSFDYEISGSTPCDGSFQWNPIPDFPTEAARIRISDITDPAVEDRSDSDFIIEPAPSGWVPKDDIPLPQQPYQIGVTPDIAVHSNGLNQSRGEVVQELAGIWFRQYNDDYSTPLVSWNYVVPVWLQDEGVWIESIRKFDTNIIGDRIVVTNDDDHESNPIEVVDPFHGAFSSNDNLTGEFSFSDSWGKPDFFFHGDSGIFSGVPDPELLPWRYISDVSSGVPGGIQSDDSVLYVAPTSHLEPDPDGMIIIGYWLPPFDELTIRRWGINAGQDGTGSGIIDDSYPPSMALAIDDDTGLAIYDYTEIVTYWILDSSSEVQAVVLGTGFSEPLAVLPADRLDAEELGSRIPVDIEMLPAKDFDLQLTYFNWLAVLLDNGDGTWSLGVWEYEYIQDPDGWENGSKFHEIGITESFPGIPASLDVDCTDFEVHVLYENPGGDYSVMVFEFIPDES